MAKARGKASAANKKAAVKSAKAQASKATNGRRGPRGPREPIEVPSAATFGVDDKRAQYARLVVFNFAKSGRVKGVKVPKGADVNSVSNDILSRAAVELAGGTLLKGPEALEMISDLSRNGATDAKVAERGLTKAYAAEVRPFLRRARLADSFGRRSRPRAKAETQEEVAESA